MKKSTALLLVIILLAVTCPTLKAWAEQPKASLSFFDNWDENICNNNLYHAITMASADLCTYSGEAERMLQWNALEMDQYSFFAAKSRMSNKDEYENIKDVNKGIVYYSKSQNTILVAFQGSQNIEQWLADFDFSSVDAGNGVRIHKGFYEGIYDYFLSMSTQLYFETKNNGSKALMEMMYDPSVRFIITGHSYGGALAQVLHYGLVNRCRKPQDAICTYTFASPIPFQGVQDPRAYHCFNYINDMDLVTHVGIVSEYGRPTYEPWKDIVRGLNILNRKWQQDAVKLSKIVMKTSNNIDDAAVIYKFAHDLFKDVYAASDLIELCTGEKTSYTSGPFLKVAQKMLGQDLCTTKAYILVDKIRSAIKKLQIGNSVITYTEFTTLANTFIQEENLPETFEAAVEELYNLFLQNGSDGMRIGQKVAISSDTRNVKLSILEQIAFQHDLITYITYMNAPEDAGNQEDILDLITYDSSSAAGDVTNMPTPQAPTQSELNTFSVTPIDVVLVLDASGSMEEKRNPNNGKSVLSYAQDAAVAFAQTLFALNPESRISVVKYESEVETVCNLTQAKDSIALQSSIRFIRSGGKTNTGGGYERANEILNSQAESSRKCVVLMLSDGMANVGPDAVTEGKRVAQSASVYTIGLVGGMSASEKDITHQILREGYQTQYFEVDFSSVSDISLYLAESFLKIAMTGGQDAQETYYSLRVDGAMEVRVAKASGETLCSASDMLDTASGYGTLHFLGDEMDDKLLVLRGGDYDILLRGTGETVGNYALTSFNGVGADIEDLLDSAVKLNPASCIALHVKDGKVTQENIPFNPIDPFAIDPFTGAPTKGLSLATQGYAAGNTTVYSANHKKAFVLEKLSKNAPLDVFAMDPLTGWYLVGITGKDGLPLRGWAEGNTLDVKGYVPEMQFIGGEYTLTESSPLCLTPSNASRVAGQIASGTVVELKHVERDRSGEEWAYVKTIVKNKDTWAYVPSRMLAEYKSIAPEGFRLGGDMPLNVYDKTFGENKYSEWMWVSSPVDGGGGVILSGRTASTKGDITKALGGRDAWVMRLDGKGDVSKALTTGGSEVDSYHCVLPTEQGYLVSGITRSLDKNFQGIWDTGYFLGTVPQRLSWSNALIGLLDESFEPIWLKSFGISSGSYGFDMVLKLADGNFAGVGWSTTGSGSVLSDHGKQDFYAVKITQSGQILAMNCYGGAMDDVPDGGIATPDGGILMIGRTSSSHTGGGRYDGYVLKLDASLAVQWEFSYGGNGEDTFDNVRMLDDGTYLVTGFTNSTTGTGVGKAKGCMDFWAMRIDQFGRPIWNLRYGGSGDEELRGTTLLNDGRLILLGDTTSQDGQVRGYQRTGGKASPTDGWAVCINEMGKVLWQYCQGGTGNDYFNSAAIDPADGCLVLAGVKDRKNDENSKAWVVKIQIPAYMQGE